MSTATPAVAPEEQLAYEARTRSRMAALAVAGGVLLVAAAAVQLGGPHTAVDELTTDLIVANQRFPLDLIASIINGVASLSIAAALAYLWRCSNARNRDVRGYIRAIAVAGGILSGVTGIVYAIVVAGKVHTFVSTGAQTYEEANHLTSSGILVVMQLVGQAGALLLAVGVALVALNAMRQGLLSRFMGYLGVFAGVLVLFQITQIPIVQGYWFAALGYLFSGRWPSGHAPRVDDRPGRALAAVLGAARPPRGRRGPGPGPGPAPDPVPAEGPVTDARGPAPRRPSASASAAARPRRARAGREEPGSCHERPPFVVRFAPFAGPSAPLTDRGLARADASGQRATHPIHPHEEERWKPIAYRARPMSRPRLKSPGGRAPAGSRPIRVRWVWPGSPARRSS